MDGIEVETIEADGDKEARVTVTYRFAMINDRTDTGSSRRRPLPADHGH